MTQLEREWGSTPMSKKASGYHIRINRYGNTQLAFLTFSYDTGETVLSNREMQGIYERYIMKGMKQYFVRLRKFQQDNVDFDFPELFQASVDASGKLAIITSTIVKVKDREKLESYADDFGSYLEAIAQGIGVKVSFDR
jgi:hypothetical protein